MRLPRLFLDATPADHTASGATPCNIAEIALPATLAAEAGATNQGFDGYFIRALALLPRATTEGGI